MCPICLVNLCKAATGTLQIRDISEYLAEAVTARADPAAMSGKRQHLAFVQAGRARPLWYPVGVGAIDPCRIGPTALPPAVVPWAC